MEVPAQFSGSEVGQQGLDGVGLEGTLRNLWGPREAHTFRTAHDWGWANKANIWREEACDSVTGSGQKSR